jgi:hypothetical protein
MPPIVIAGMAAVGGTILAKWLIREAKRVNAELDARRTSESARDSAPKLRRDPQTGAYRPE